jgi:hypothetical protein
MTYICLWQRSSESGVVESGGEGLLPIAFSQRQQGLEVFSLPSGDHPHNEHYDVDHCSIPVMGCGGLLACGATRWRTSQDVQFPTDQVSKGRTAGKCQYVSYSGSPRPAHWAQLPSSHADVRRTVAARASRDYEAHLQIVRIRIRLYHSPIATPSPSRKSLYYHPQLRHGVRLLSPALVSLNYYRAMHVALAPPSD